MVNQNMTSAIFNSPRDAGGVVWYDEPSVRRGTNAFLLAPPSSRLSSLAPRPSYLLACFVCFTFVLACSKNPTDIPSQTTPSVAEEPVAPSAADDTELTNQVDANDGEVSTDSMESLDDDTMIAVAKNTVRVVAVESAGSGVIIGRDADRRLYILTAWHATKDPIQRVELYAYDSLEYPAPYASLPRLEVFSTSQRRDLAILRTSQPELGLDVQGLKLGNVKASKPTNVYSSGCVDGEPPLILREQLIGRKKVTRGEQAAIMWKTKSPQQTGRSGGPLVNQRGSIVGIASGKHGGNGYYCHIEEIAEYLVDTLGDSIVRCDTSGD